MLTNWFEHQPSAQQQCLSTSMITMMDHIRTGKHTNSSCLLFSLSALSVIYLWTQRQGLTGPSLCRLTKSRSVTSLPSVSAVCALVYHRLCVWAQTFSHMTRQSHWKKDGYCARRCTATSLFFNWKFIQTYPNVSARGWSLPIWCHGSLSWLVESQLVFQRRTCRCYSHPVLSSTRLFFRQCTLVKSLFPVCQLTATLHFLFYKPAQCETLIGWNWCASSRHLRLRAATSEAERHLRSFFPVAMKLYKSSL